MTVKKSDTYPNESQISILNHDTISNKIAELYFLNLHMISNILFAKQKDVY